jgi:hypothetical protein
MNHNKNLALTTLVAPVVLLSIDTDTMSYGNRVYTANKPLLYYNCYYSVVETW